MGVYPQSIPSFGVHTLHGRRMKLFSTFKKFHTHKTFIPTNSGPLGKSIPKRPQFRLCEVYPRLLRGETHDSGTVRRVTKLEIILERQIQTFPNLFFVFSILKNHTLKTYPRMDAAWKKGAYPGKRCIPSHGLQKKAVRYGQVYNIILIYCQKFSNSLIVVNRLSL